MVLDGLPDTQSQRSGWLDAAGWITCIDPLPSAADRPPDGASAGPEQRSRGPNAGADALAGGSVLESDVAERKRAS